jgi:hypothetical protein
MSENTELIALMVTESLEKIKLSLTFQSPVITL